MNNKPEIMKNKKLFNLYNFFIIINNSMTIDKLILQ